MEGQRKETGRAKGRGITEMLLKPWQQSFTREDAGSSRWIKETTTEITGLITLD